MYVTYDHPTSLLPGRTGIENVRGNRSPNSLPLRPPPLYWSSCLLTNPIPVVHPLTLMEELLLHRAWSFALSVEDFLVTDVF